MKTKKNEKNRKEGTRDTQPNTKKNAEKRRATREQKKRLERNDNVAKK